MLDHCFLAHFHSRPIKYVTWKDRGLGQITIALLIGSFAFLSGCALPSWSKGPGLDGPNAILGEGLRPKGKSEMPGTGLDQRARDIEKNLGLKT
jgi:hypothetical protein